MKKHWLISSLLALGLAWSPAADAKGKRIGEAAAARAARAVVGGRVVDVDYEHRSHGRSYYQVEIKRDGQEYKVIVDAKTGRVLSTRRDDDDDRRYKSSRAPHHDQYAGKKHGKKYGKKRRHHDDDDDDDDDDD